MDATYTTLDALKAYLAEQYAAGTPVTVVHPLAEPYTIQLTPQQLTMLKGCNAIWCDAGDTALSYVVETQDCIDASIEEEQQALRARRNTPMVTFMDDDGRVEVLDKLKPLSEKYGVPFVVAMITERLTDDHPLYMTPADLVMLQNAGWEISSHTHTHPHIDELSDAEQEWEFKTSKEILESYGIRVNVITYPNGRQGRNTYQIAKKYFAAGRDTQHRDYINETPLETWNIRSSPLGSFYAGDSTSGFDTSSLEYYKYLVDKAVASNGWLVFLMHCSQATHDDTQQGYLEETIKYIQSLNVPIVTLSEALERRGNIVEIGRYDREDTSIEHYVVGCDCSWSASFGGSTYLQDDSVTLETSAAEFPPGLVTKVYLSSGLNGKKGHLVTDKTWKKSTIIATQHWYAYDDSSVVAYRTVQSGTGTWLPWRYLTDRAMSTSGYLNDSAMVNYPGASIFDTTLKKPVWYNGVTWVDAAGNYVDSSFEATELKILTHPSDVTAEVQSAATFTVVAQGDGLTYQWQYSLDGGASWRTYTGTGGTSATMTTIAWNSKNGYIHRCVVTDGSGKSVVSNTATLTVTAASSTPVEFAIVEQPLDATAVLGAEAVAFTVVAQGDGLTYQWQYSKDGGTSWVTYSGAGATSATMTTAAWASRNGWQFRCIVTSGNGDTITSNAATLTVTEESTEPVELAIVTQPVSVSAEAGSDATFTVVAQGSGLTYQWHYSADSGTSWVKYNGTGGTTATMTVTAYSSRNGYQYRCVVTDSSGSTVTSNVVTLTIAAAQDFAIVTHPADVTAAQGSTAAFTVVATGSGLTYQWHYSKDSGATWYKSSDTSATAATLETNAYSSRNGYMYRCLVTDGDGNTILSNTATLTVV